jgi:hypothetical protein
MKLRTYYGILLLFLLILLTGILAQREHFTSPGTMVQLATSHVPTQEDIPELEEYNRQVRRDLIDMTGSA